MATLVAAGCQGHSNYMDSVGPRFSGAAPPHVQTPASGDTLRVVTFNIQFAQEPERAVAALTRNPELSGADVVLLQEMDLPGTRYIARELGMAYVYYPATRHYKHGRDFGNAVLSRWPIVSDKKLLLPHSGRIYRTLRTATAATIRVGNDSVRVYSTHLSTLAHISPSQRRAQLQAILDDAAAFEKVIIGGDFNHERIAELAVQQAYIWLTEHVLPTAAAGRLDHILVRGLSIPRAGGAGTVLDTAGASDHRPVWAIVILR